MSAVSVSGLSKSFGHLKVLKDIDLPIEAGDFTVLLGPSGCGKSTLLNAIAGFTPPSAGEILAFGKRVLKPEPARAMVFQEYALFPWMTVRENVAFGLRIRGDREARAKADALLDKLALRGFGDRFPKDLSGGMRQRVALARCLALDAPMLLMDEPFGALDALTRRSMQDELLRIWTELQQTIVFVTHGIEESLLLADRVVVMTYRPGTVKKIVTVALPRPRDEATPEFSAAFRAITQLVREEQRRHERDEQT